MVCLLVHHLYRQPAALQAQITTGSDDDDDTVNEEIFADDDE